MPWSPDGDFFDIPAPTGWWAEVVLQLAPAAAALVVIGGVPTIRVSEVVAPESAELAIVGGQPAVAKTEHVLLAPSPAELAIIGSHPALEVTFRPAAATLAITGGQPDVAISDHKTIGPNPAGISTAGGQPAIVTTEHHYLMPTAAPLAITGGQPALFASDQQVVTPDAAALVISGGEVVASVGILVRPTGADLAVDGHQPVVSTPVVAQPVAAALEIIGSHPALGTTLRPAAAALTADGGLPTVTVSDHRVFTPTGQAAAAIGGQPLVTASDHRSVIPTAATLSVAGGTPAVVVTNHQLATPTALPLSITGGQPLVVIESLPIEFDAATNLGFAAPTASGTHTCNGTAVVVAVQGATSLGTPTVSATYGGQAMTLLGTVAMGTAQTLALFGMLNPPSGPQTVTATCAGGFGPGASAVVVSYKNVGSFGTPVTNSASSGTGMSLSVPSAVDRMVAQAFAANAISGTGSLDISSYNRTQRATVPTSNRNLLVGDAAGASSVSFSATTSRSSVWAAIGVDLRSA